MLPLVLTEPETELSYLLETLCYLLETLHTKFTMSTHRIERFTMFLQCTKLKITYVIKID